jgi:hypothetical protein
VDFIVADFSVEYFRFLSSVYLNILSNILTNTAVPISLSQLGYVFRSLVRTVIRYRVQTFKKANLYVKTFAYFVRSQSSMSSYSYPVVAIEYV